MATSASAQTLRVYGYREFMLALAGMPREMQRDLREALRESGERVRKDSASKTAGILDSPKSASGYRVYVRQRSVDVEQSLRKTTGLRPKWGGVQMRRSLVPSLLENEPHTVDDFERAAEQITDFFELRARWVAAGFLPS